MRFVDIMLCFPTFFLILAVITVREPSIWNIMIVIGLTGWMGVARLVRAETPLDSRDGLYPGGPLHRPARMPRIIFRHILPNAMSPVLGVRLPGGGRCHPDRIGALLSRHRRLATHPPVGAISSPRARTTSNSPWWLSLFPGLSILLTVLAYNLLGEGIRDALDPRVKR